MNKKAQLEQFAKKALWIILFLLLLVGVGMLFKKLIAGA